MQNCKFLIHLILLALLASCESTQNQEQAKQKEVEVTITKDTTALKSDEFTETKVNKSSSFSINDTLEDLVNYISGRNDHEYKTLSKFRKEKGFLEFSEHFTKRWKKFDSTKLKNIKTFVSGDFKNYAEVKNVFYPFSGPDVLYSTTLFPNATKLSLIGLEPVGTLPIIDDKDILPDSIHKYFGKINTSLNAILNFSFFRTVSMKEDLRNEEVDGTIHLILLFLNKTGHKIQSIKPFYIDSLGNKYYVKNTSVLKNKKYKNSSIEIIAATENNISKTITYTSTDLSDAGLYRNKGLKQYLSDLQFETTYLKGASYLMHKPSFSKIRNIILENASCVVQDDSGIAVDYILNDKNKWEFNLFGEYIKPINMFAQHYQPSLDSLYKTKGAKKLGFGLGYNYRDKNSNFMVIKKARS